MNTIPTAGAASNELVSQLITTWGEAAKNAGIELIGFDPSAPLEDRLSWARTSGLSVGAVLTRFSSKESSSTTAQAVDCVRFAPSKGIYVPPEYVCVDEAVTGRKMRRVGLDRVKYILKNKMAEVLLVFKMSRLFRSSYQGTKFINEDVVEEGLRAISVTQNIDTDDEKTWKSQIGLHGIMDEMLLGAIADHVRSGLQELFRQGYVTGALPVGYVRREVPDGRKTKLGRPRTAPAVQSDTAELIKQHYKWIRDGMSVREGWRRWLKAGGPCDPRSPTGRMTYIAYRRMLSNIRYTGRWLFCEKRNQWKSKLDYNLQVKGPADEVVKVLCDELRILDDDLFFAVQLKLLKNHRGPKIRTDKPRTPQLWDLVVDCFYCSECKVRFHQTGANGKSMYCKRDVACPCNSFVRRQEAVLAVCGKLAELLKSDGKLIEDTIVRAVEIDAAGELSLQDELNAGNRKLAGINRKIDDLAELAGEGSDEDRKKWKAKVTAAQKDRATVQLELACLEKRINRSKSPITAEQVRSIIANFTTLIVNGAAGLLGDDFVYLAGDVFRQLVDGRIDVHVERRAARSRSNVVGIFRPNLIATIGRATDAGIPGAHNDDSTVRVWLRQPPLRDRLAERVHHLIDVERHTYRSAAKVLQEEGYNVNSGVVWQIYRRYYEMTGKPTPKLPYDSSRRRRAG
jgi:DNA invertase Pin-like site-specific DNA recombinase